MPSGAAVTVYEGKRGREADAPVPSRPPLVDYERRRGRDAAVGAPGPRRHSDYSTTQRYIDLAGETFREEARAARAAARRDRSGRNFR